MRDDYSLVWFELFLIWLYSFDSIPVQYLLLAIGKHIYIYHYDYEILFAFECSSIFVHSTQHVP